MNLLKPNGENIITDKNLLFTGEDYKKVQRFVKDYIKKLSKQGNKIFLLDSFWTIEKYNRFLNSKYRNEIERRYHIKLSVEDFLSKDNIFEYMDSKELNIIKVKSIEGIMSATELFPVIISKINGDLKDERAYILINDFVLKELNDDEFEGVYNNINGNLIKFLIFNNQVKIINSVNKIIDKIIKVR